MFVEGAERFFFLMSSEKIAYNTNVLDIIQ